VFHPKIPFPGEKDGVCRADIQRTVNPIQHLETDQQPERTPLGQILFETGLLSAEDLDRVLAEQRETGLPLGRMLVEGGYLPARTVALALADQHGGPLKTEYGFAVARPSMRREPESTPAAEPAAAPDIESPPDPVEDVPTASGDELQTAPMEAPQLRVPDPVVAHVLVEPVVEAPVLEQMVVQEPVPEQPVAEQLVVPADDAVREELAAAQAQMNGLRDQLATALTARSQSEGTVAVLSSRIEDIGRQLTGANARIEELEVELTGARELRAAVDGDAIKTLLAESEAQAAALASRVEELGAQLTDANGRAAEAQAALGRAEQIADEATHTIVEAQAAETLRATSEAKVSSLEARIQELVRELAEAKADAERAHAAVAAADERATAAEGAQAAAQAETNELRTRAAEAPEAVAAQYEGGGHSLFVPTASGYELAEREGAPPVTGEFLELAGHTYRVLRVGALPGEHTACAYLEHAPLI
jgi:predicted  nucleic acid-binding Zn-ribbon protein